MSSSAMDSNTDATNFGQKPDPSIVFTPKISDPWTIDKVLTTLSEHKPMEKSCSPVPYFHILERLKTTKREGWKRFGISRGESIADHMYRMSLMTMFAPPSLAQRLDLNKCMKMCLIHDMAESLVGDIIPADGVSKLEKNRRETSAMDYITQRLLGNLHDIAPNVGENIRAIWQEHEDSKTPESHFVQDIDKIELMLQMVEYERRGEGKIDLSEFAYVATKLSLLETQAWAKEILQERKDFWGREELDQDETGEEGDALSRTRRMQDEYYDSK